MRSREAVRESGAGTTDAGGPAPPADDSGRPVLAGGASAGSGSVSIPARPHGSSRAVRGTLNVWRNGNRGGPAGITRTPEVLADRLAKSRSARSVETTRATRPSSSIWKEGSGTWKAGTLKRVGSGHRRARRPAPGPTARRRRRHGRRPRRRLHLTQTPTCPPAHDRVHRRRAGGARAACSAMRAGRSFR